MPGQVRSENQVLGLNRHRSFSVIPTEAEESLTVLVFGELFRSESKRYLAPLDFAPTKPREIGRSLPFILSTATGKLQLEKRAQPSHEVRPVLAAFRLGQLFRRRF